VASDIQLLTEELLESRHGPFRPGRERSGARSPDVPATVRQGGPAFLIREVDDLPVRERLSYHQVVLLELLVEVLVQAPDLVLVDIRLVPDLVEALGDPDASVVVQPEVGGHERLDQIRNEANVDKHEIRRLYKYLDSSSSRTTGDN